MRTKHVLVAFAAVLGLLLVFPESVVAQKKSKKEKTFVWEMPKPSGDKDIDAYLSSCDSLYNLISTYRSDLATYQYREVAFSAGGKDYLLKCMIDSVGNKFLSEGMGRWQAAHAVLIGTQIALDATALSLQTATAALALPNLGLKAFSYIKPVKDLGPHVIGQGIKEIPELRKEWQTTMRKYSAARQSAIAAEALEPAVRDLLMTEMELDADTFNKWYGKYIFIAEDIHEAAEGMETQMVEKTEAEKDAGNLLTDYKNFGVSDLPEDLIPPSEEEEYKLLNG
ncbi:MAG: hypothetical protein LBV32_09430 [Tannerellaceae bacterium]|nr:hypothetical protein [Tannerellaceae bacterium]